MANPAWSKRPLHELDEAQREAYGRRRAQLLPAAAETVARLGSAATMADVARTAGVGMSSVYRTFSSKEELLETLLALRHEEWIGIWLEAEARPDAGPALVDAMWAFVELEHRDIGLASALRELAQRRRDLIAGADAIGARVLGRAQAAGAVRDDVDYEDIIRVFGMLSRLREEREWRRGLALYLDGMLAPPGARRSLRR